MTVPHARRRFRKVAENVVWPGKPGAPEEFQVRALTDEERKLLQQLGVEDKRKRGERLATKAL